MGNQYNAWDRFYQRLNMTFHGVVAVSLIPFAWSFLETQTQFPEGPLVTGMSALVLKSGLFVGSLALGYLTFKAHKILPNKVDGSVGLQEKLDQYLRLKLRLFALLESSGILAVVGLYLLKDHLFTGLYLVILFAFSLARPTYDKIVQELQLSQEEENRLKKGKF